MNLLVILGATCSGKSKMSVQIAQKYQKMGQKVAIVNCDSRQIYQNLDIGTAKVNGNWQKLNSEIKGNQQFANNSNENKQENPKIEENIKQKTSESDQNSKQSELEKENSTIEKSLVCKQNLIEQQFENAFFWEGIPHFLIDFVPVSLNYNLVDFVQNWCELIAFWQENNSFDLVILTGGTGLWAKAITENFELGIIKKQHLENWQNLKTELGKMNLKELQEKYLAKSGNLENSGVLKNSQNHKTEKIRKMKKLENLEINRKIEFDQSFKYSKQSYNSNEKMLNLESSFLENDNNSETKENFGKLVNSENSSEIKNTKNIKNLELYAKSYQFAKSPFQGRCPLGGGYLKSEFEKEKSQFSFVQVGSNLSINDEIDKKKQNNSNQNSQTKSLIQNQIWQNKTEIIQKNPSETGNFQKINSNLENLETTNSKIQKLGQNLGQKLNNSDFQNPVRLINWLLRQESCEQNWQEKINYPKFIQTKIVAIKTDKTELNQKIAKSVKFRINLGLLWEVENLVARFERQKIWNLGLEYRESLRLLGGEIDVKTWENNLITQNQQYAKRQITWLNKENLTGNLLWIERVEELEKLLENWKF